MAPISQIKIKRSLIPVQEKNFKNLLKDAFCVSKNVTLTRICQTKHIGYYCKRFHNSAVSETRETQRLSGNPQSTNLVYNKNLVLLQMADVILFNNFNQREVRIKAPFYDGSQRSCFKTCSEYFVT